MSGQRTTSGEDTPVSDGIRNQLHHLTLRQPVHITREATLQGSALLMRKEGISSLVVDTEPVSFLTERDLVRALAEGRAPTEPVAAVATRAPVWVPPTVTVEHAAALMIGLGVRHLLVIDPTDAVVGILSIRDAFEALLPAFDPDRWLAAIRAGLVDER